MLQIARALTILSLVTLVGCGSGPVTSVTGTVFVNNVPAADLQVTFTATINGKEVTASGTSDTAGQFKLALSESNSKLPVGKYKVTVIDLKSIEQGEPTPGAPKLPPSRVPNAYADITSTPVEISVEANKTDYEVRVEARR